MILNRTRIIDSSIILIVLALIVLVLSLSLGLPRVLAQDFNFNLSDISDNSSFDLKDLLSSFKAVNGTYTNSDYGFEIAFPKGWVGTEFSGPFGKIVSTSASELGTNADGLSAMSVMFIDNRNNTALAMISNLTNPVGAATSQVSGSASIEEPRCKSVSFSPVTINGIKGEEGTYNCDNMMSGTGQNASVKAKGLTFATNDNSLILISFAGSTNLYDKELSNFEDSVKTVKISNPGDLSTSEIYKAYKKALSQQLNN
jgi:hypothetical protein